MERGLPGAPTSRGTSWTGRAPDDSGRRIKEGRTASLLEAPFGVVMKSSGDFMFPSKVVIRIFSSKSHGVSRTK